jgi:hypothetical protein
VAGPAPIILCAGQYGSASTWLYNAVHALAEAEWGPVHRQFADNAEQLPPQADATTPLVLKAHAPTRGLRWVLARGGGRAIITLRDPRDAVASLMARFGFDYGFCRPRVEDACHTLPLLQAAMPCLVLRYEDGFSRDPATLGRVAEFLGLSPGPALLRQVFEQLTPDAVRARIAGLVESGALGPNPTAHAHDGTTHWHPGHVGDGLPGKFATVLTEGQAADIARRGAAFGEAFGYALPAPEPLRPGETRRLEGFGPGIALLGAGFAVPDAEGAWLAAREATLHLRLPAGPARRLLLEVETPAPARPPRLTVTLSGTELVAAALGRGVVSVPLPPLDRDTAVALGLRAGGAARLRLG